MDTNENSNLIHIIYNPIMPNTTANTARALYADVPFRSAPLLSVGVAEAAALSVAVAAAFPLEPFSVSLNLASENDMMYSGGGCGIRGCCACG
jgi:hypothetical protein